MRIHDGAYGTLLAHHLHGGETADDLSIRASSIVIDAHRAYLDAGARALQTNTFLTHLRGSERRRRELQRAALACAREAAALVDEDVLVIGSIGPAGSDARDFWGELEALLDAGVDAVLCETITDRAVADAFLAAWADVARGVEDVELLVGCSVAPSGGPDAIRWVLELAQEAPVEARLGLNCCEGPGGLRQLLAELVDLRPGTWVMPSAGLPDVAVGTEPTWPLQEPARWADAVRELIDGLPVAGVGGCCGTTPSSIGALAST